jgi:hypothetical protein
MRKSLADHNHPQASQKAEQRPETEHLISPEMCGMSPGKKIKSNSKRQETEEYPFQALRMIS